MAQIMFRPKDMQPFAPARTNQNNVTFHGGRVLDAPVYTPIYLGKYWTTAQGQADKAHNDAFAQEYGTSAHESILKQYNVGQGSFGGSSVVNVANPSRVTEDDVQKLVKQQLASGAVKPNAQGVYTVVLPPGTILDAGDVTSEDGLGGFHGSYNDAGGKKVYYAVIAYSKGNNGIDFDGNAQDNISITESHEWDEAATDPDVNNGTLGWYNDKLNMELSDEAISQLSLSDAFGTDNGFVVQKEWSNKDGQFEVTPK